MTGTKRELTFRHNLNNGRHGWLRLTPAYSVKMVEQIVDQHSRSAYVLDPFSGTGTTGLVCGENGVRCDLIDINPFLVWFATAKTRSYLPLALNVAKTSTLEIIDRTHKDYRRTNLWFPAISNIDRWWAQEDLIFLSNLHARIHERLPEQSDVRDLILVAFCRLLMELSNASFDHQSMSFNAAANDVLRTELDRGRFLSRFISIMDDIIESAARPIAESVCVKLADSRNVPFPEHGLYDAVITSPPYPNRMSYIRELRPYMYWLKHIDAAREAGELDWLAIGGTWGIATSRVGEWQPNGVDVDSPELHMAIEQISENSDLLARYVHKYFVDMLTHLLSLYPTLSNGAQVFYIVGNSKFYNTVVPVEKIYAHLLDRVGFENVTIEIVRKRNSKKELFEFCVSGNKPGHQN